MKLTIAFDRETDGRWIATVEELPGVYEYGQTQDEATARAQALAFSVLADEIEHGERDPKTLLSVEFVAPRAA